MSAGLPPEALELMAEAIHERYRKNQAERKPSSDPAMRPWAELNEALKRSNRDQAAGVEEKLALLGCRIVPAGEVGPELVLTPEDVERLAILEHDRWVRDRLAAGWTAGPVRDPARRVTPYLVPWEALGEEVREWDREAVRAIPEVLAAAGLTTRPVG